MEPAFWMRPHAFEEPGQSLIRVYPRENGRALANVAECLCQSAGYLGLAAADAARVTGIAPTHRCVPQ